MVSNGCQWIEDDPAVDPTKCGKETVPDSSYCSDHHFRCYIPLPRRIRTKVDRRIKWIADNTG